VCELLRSSGVAGRPEEHFQHLRATSRSRQPRQYFETLDDPAVLELLPEIDPGTPETDDEFADHLSATLRDATTPNGVFGTKVMWSYFEDFEARLRTLAGFETLPLEDAIDELLPDVHYVQIIRRDKVGQAVSLWTAVQTQQWRDEGSSGDRPELVYNYAAIDHLVRQLSEQERAWTRWLQLVDRPVHRLVYEKVAQDPQAAIMKLLGDLGIEDRPSELPPPTLRKQADERSREWIDRFHAERAERRQERHSPDVTWHPTRLDRAERWEALGQRGATVWLTGLPASGKSTIAAALEQRLVHEQRFAYLLDGDNIRHGLSGDLGFDHLSRSENIRRVGQVSRLIADGGGVAIVAMVSPYRSDRDAARQLHIAADLPFIEVHVQTPVEECAKRDPKGLYARASRGEITGFTGSDAPYEEPGAPEVTIRTLEESVEDAVERLVAAVDGLGALA
jgi:adenylyl-sulfate kinase